MIIEDLLYSLIDTAEELCQMSKYQNKKWQAGNGRQHVTHGNFLKSVKGRF